MKNPFPHLLLPFQIGPTVFKNRIVSLPVYTGYAHPGGRVSDMMINHYTALAHSGASMIVVANAAVSENGVVSKYNLRIDTDECIPGLKKLSTAIKSAGAVACLQLNHAGKFAKTSNPMMPSALNASHVAFNINSLKHFMEFFPFENRFGLTQNFLKMASNWDKGITDEEKESLKQAYVNASVRAWEAGFQGIELHGANGYLICQFLSGFTNKKTDGRPKSFSDRMLFPLDLVKEIKRNLPDTILFGYRIILEEWVPDGIDLKESLKWAKHLQDENISYLSVSAGTYNSMFAPEVRRWTQKPAYLTESTRQLKAVIDIPVIAAGRITHPKTADHLIRTRVADMIGLGRPLRADSNWIKKTRSKSETIKVCINCNWCLKRVVLDSGFNCRRWTQLEQEKIEVNHRLLGLNSRSVWILPDKTDIPIYKNTLTTFLPSVEAAQRDFRPSVLLLNLTNGLHLNEREVRDFITWAERTMHEKGFQQSQIQSTTLDPDSSPDKVVASEISIRDSGMVLICKNPSQAWRTRLPYRFRGKIVGLLGTAPNQNKILVPIDMSRTTAFMLSFIRHNYVNSRTLTFNFIHVLEDKGYRADRRWKQLVSIAGFDICPPLELIPKSDSISQAILKQVTSGRFGSVFMGKRSISKVKRWLLGTTSAAVLDGLQDESLFIIE